MIPTFWLLVGAVIVYYGEGWSIVDSIYWSVVSTGTVGFGDLHLEQEGTRRLVTLYMLFAVGGCAVSLGKLGAMGMEIEMDRDVDKFVARGVSQVFLSPSGGWLHLLLYDLRLLAFTADGAHLWACLWYVS